MKTAVCAAAFVVLLAGIFVPWRMGTINGKSARVGVAISSTDQGTQTVFDITGKGKLSQLPVIALFGAAGAWLLLLASFLGSRGKPSEEQASRAMMMTVISCLASILLVPLGIMAYREIRGATPQLDSMVGFLGFLLFQVGALLAFFGGILIARSLPSVPARLWPHREF
jgi:hypothetical protein